MKLYAGSAKIALFCIVLSGLTACSNLQNRTQSYSYGAGHSYAVTPHLSDLRNTAYGQTSHVYNRGFIQPNFAPMPYVQSVNYNQVQPYVRLDAGRLAVAQYTGRCLYPNDEAADGTRCGKRAAMLRPGGFYPY